MIIKKTHIGAYGIVIKDDKIALVRKARGGYKGKLDLPGGGIEHTESIEEALHRELKEELNATVTKETLYKVTTTNIKWKINSEKYEDLHHIGILYKVEIKEEKIKETPDGLDSEGASWYNINELDINELSPFAKEVVLELNEK